MPHRADLERAISTRISPIARAWLRAADQVVAGLNLSSPTAWALVHLQRLGDAARQADLARVIGISEASLVRTLHQLEKAGWVVRAPDAGDRRANRLELTPAGRALADEIDGRLVALRAELLADIPTADLEAVVRAFDLASTRIAERLKQP
jgi:MarR family transcriptional regulator for hemolysin